MALRADVDALAGMERRSASEGERTSAAWCAGRLTEAGAVDVELQPFDYQHSFGFAHALHFAVAALGRLPAMAALASFEADYSGRGQPLRKLLPMGEGANVVGRLAAVGEHERTLVLVAHHDAAHTGLMWHPALVGAGSTDTGRQSFALLPELAMAAMAIGPWRIRPLARALLAVSAALSLQVDRGATVPGASDNASGVAAILALMERLVADPLPGVEVIVLLPGAEEAGMGGMAAWMRAVGSRLDPASTLVLGLDTLGAGEPMVASSEGPLWSVHYAPADLDLADAGARRAGVVAPRRFRVGGWTDPVLARLAGLRTISLLSLHGRGFTDYHLPTDTPDRVDWGSVDMCLDLAEGIARVWGEPAGAR